MKYIILVLFSVNISFASDVMDLGILDIKGKLNLPKYSMQSDILTLKTSIHKIAQMEYLQDSKHEPGKDLINLRFPLAEKSDFDFDLNIKKVRLD